MAMSEFCMQIIFGLRKKLLCSIRCIQKMRYETTIKEDKISTEQHK
jgi:hypothetical protein